MLLPSGLNAAPHPRPEGSSGAPTGSPVAASHRRAVLSSMQPARIVLPSGLNATYDTGAECTMGWPMGWPVATSQRRAVLSVPPVQMVVPSGLRATDRTSAPNDKTAFGMT